MLHDRRCNLLEVYCILLLTLLKVLGNKCLKGEGHMNFLTVVKRFKLAQTLFSSYPIFLLKCKTPIYRSNPMLKGESHWVGWGRARWVPGMSVGYGWSVAGCETYCRDPIGQRYVIALESYLSVMCSIVMCLVLPRFVLFGYLWLSPLKQVNNSRTRSVTLICYLLNQPAIPRPANYTLVKISRLVGKISTSTPF